MSKFGTSQADASDISELERSLLTFRRIYWAAGFDQRGDTDAILHAVQKAFGLPSTEAALARDLTELSRQTQALAAEATNSALGLLAIVGLPLTAALAMWQGLADTGYSSLVRTLLLTVSATALVILAVPAFRDIARRILRRQP